MENGDEDKDNEPVDEASGAYERIEDGSSNSGKKKRPKKKKKKKQDVTHEVSTSPVEVRLNSRILSFFFNFQGLCVAYLTYI